MDGAGTLFGLKHKTGEQRQPVKKRASLRYTGAVSKRDAG